MVKRTKVPSEGFWKHQFGSSRRWWIGEVVWVGTDTFAHKLIREDDPLSKVTSKENVLEDADIYSMAVVAGSMAGQPELVVEPLAKLDEVLDELQEARSIHWASQWADLILELLEWLGCLCRRWAAKGYLWLGSNEMRFKKETHKLKESSEAPSKVAATLPSSSLFKRTPNRRFATFWTLLLAFRLIAGLSARKASTVLVTSASTTCDKHSDDFLDPEEICSEAAEADCLS